MPPATRTPPDFLVAFYVRQLLPISNLFIEAMRVRVGYTLRFIHADGFFRALAQARVGNSIDRTFRSS